MRYVRGSGQMGWAKPESTPKGWRHFPLKFCTGLWEGSTRWEAGRGEGAGVGNEAGDGHSQGPGTKRAQEGLWAARGTQESGRDAGFG